MQKVQVLVAATVVVQVVAVQVLVAATVVVQVVAVQVLEAGAVVLLIRAVRDHPLPFPHTTFRDATRKG